MGLASNSPHNEMQFDEDNKMQLDEDHKSSVSNLQPVAMIIRQNKFSRDGNV